MGVDETRKPKTLNATGSELLMSGTSARARSSVAGNGGGPSPGLPLGKEGREYAVRNV